MIFEDRVLFGLEHLQRKFEGVTATLTLVRENTDGSLSSSPANFDRLTILARYPFDVGLEEVIWNKCYTTPASSEQGWLVGRGGQVFPPSPDMEWQVTDWTMGVASAFAIAQQNGHGPEYDDISIGKLSPSDRQKLRPQWPTNQVYICLRKSIFARGCVGISSRRFHLLPIGV